MGFTLPSAGATPAPGIKRSRLCGEAVLSGFAAGAPAMLHLEEDGVVHQFSDRETGAREFDCRVAGVALVAVELDAVPPGRRMIARSAQIQNQFEVLQGARD